MTPVANHRELLARRLHEEHREPGGAFWRELDDADKEAWYRVARHLERNLSVGALAQVARP